ncbi:uncharacterized protein LOC128196247 [Vigna angularis]|uniref:uncharacterized protein LOC128196247 n=1 Tax=Phaseolus angularis TaxID=3914 RepID=UPI0022B549FF|nr:uncharacterized protein LOC128196247 [Vigna angularis]
MRLNPAKCIFGVPNGKFLGFMLTSRGIEANPEKCRTVLEMRSPSNLKETQRLVGRLTSLSRFIPKLVEHVRSMLRNMKKGVTQHWDNQCPKAFDKVKDVLANPPIMARPVQGHDLQLYLATSHNMTNAALIQEAPDFRLVYFVSRTLQGPEERYSQIEKVALALLTIVRRLRSYFQSHQVVVRTDNPIAKILRKPDLARRMLVSASNDAKWPWLLHVDGSIDRRGSEAGIVLEGPNSISVDQAVIFKFHVSNNQVEYEALIVGLTLAKELGITNLECRMDSQIVVGHLKGTFQVKDNQLLRYFHQATHLFKSFPTIDIAYIPREQNSRADLLSKLAHSRGKGQLSSVIKVTLDKPAIEVLATNTATPIVDWRKDIHDLMKRQERGEQVSIAESKRIARFFFVGEDLYKRGYTTPLLKCLSEEQVVYVLRELHHGVCGSHSGRHTLKARALRAGYYWPTMDRDCDLLINKCIPCQEHDNHVRIPPEELHDNGRQFIDIKLAEFLLGIKHVTSSVEHPYTNGQAEAANKAVIAKLKRKLGDAKVVMLPVEVGEPSLRRDIQDMNINNEKLRLNLDTLSDK